MLLYINIIAVVTVLQESLNTSSQTITEVRKHANSLDKLFMHVSEVGQVKVEQQ